jgi:hypothetical protein
MTLNAPNTKKWSVFEVMEELFVLISLLQIVYMYWNVTLHPMYMCNYCEPIKLFK